MAKVAVKNCNNNNEGIGNILSKNIRVNVESFGLAYVVAHFQEALHALIHVVVVQRHEQRVYNDAERDEELDERVEDEE